MTSPAPIQITLLAENTARGRGILGEHGLSYWIETPHGNLLFDTGQGMVLRSNAERLGIDLSTAGVILLSHGHYDHVGGLEQALALAPEAEVVFHSSLQQERYSEAADGSPQKADCPFVYDGRLDAASSRIRKVDHAMELLPGIRSTGQVPRETEYEDVGGNFYLDAEGRVPDLIPDDQSLFIETEQGTIVVLGCAHAGVVNTLQHIRRLTHDKPIRAVIGGMHLLHANENRMRHTLGVFQKLNIPHLSPCHCTGVHAIAAFQRHFPEAFVEAHAGKQFRF